MTDKKVIVILRLSLKLKHSTNIQIAAKVLEASKLGGNFKVTFSWVFCNCFAYFHCCNVEFYTCILLSFAGTKKNRGKKSEGKL